LNEQFSTTEFGFRGSFLAMASPCECLIETQDLDEAKAIFELVKNETARIEQKYSRYLSTNLCAAINASRGIPVPIDDETFQLLEFANQCFEISEGLFDLTSGVLRKVWRFGPEGKFPAAADVSALLPNIGWSNIRYDHNQVTLPEGMEIDFGGIGKEYAVDRCAQLIMAAYPEISVLINFGGDLRVTVAPKTREYWMVGVDSQVTPVNHSVRLKTGGVCTSGNTERFIMHQGKRYGHILNPMTGYPPEGSPATVTVLADQCLSAGLIATLAILQGAQAEAFLKAQGVKYYLQL